MNRSKPESLTDGMATQVKEQASQMIQDFLLGTAGLRIDSQNVDEIVIKQTTDSKRLPLKYEKIHEVLVRKDIEGKLFLQVNFKDNTKILLTDSLIGFKPIPLAGLTLDRLPKVVTTPDLMSVFEAFEDAAIHENQTQDTDTLRKLFYSILFGGEAIGFDLSQEKSWLGVMTSQPASA